MRRNSSSIRCVQDSISLRLPRNERQTSLLAQECRGTVFGGEILQNIFENNKVELHAITKFISDFEKIV